MKTVKTWKDLSDLISEDLAIYVLYTACAMAADTLDSLLTIMKNDEYLSDETLNAIYSDLAYGMAVDELNAHIPNGDEDLQVEPMALEEGKAALSTWMDLVNPEDAMSYLRYVLDWEEDHLDWVRDHPQSLDVFLTGKGQ